MRVLLMVLTLGCVAMSCGSKTCDGCIDSTGTCVAGDQINACGFAGAVCSSCTENHFCSAGACWPKGRDAGPLEDDDAGVADAGTRDAGVHDAGVTTYADGGSISRYWDGGSCTVKTDCPCFSSDDCGPGFRCESEDSSGANVWCVPGARGAGQPGASCTVDTDCFTGLCINDETCSSLCETTADCPASLTQCTYVGFGVDRSVCSP